MLLAPALSALAEDSAFLESERVVVAIRYLQPTGESHSHVYLYDGAGKLLRQLTNASDGQDRDPVFSRDGKVIVFRRESRGMNTFWRIALAHNTADQIREVPSWYFATVKEHVAMFEYPPFAPTAGDPADLRIRDYLSPDDVHYVAPDKTTEIVLKRRPTVDPEPNYYAKEPWLIQKDEPDRLVSELPFAPFDQSASEEEKKMRDREPAALRYESGDQPGALEGVLVYQGSPFIWNPPLRVAFLRQHRGSTFNEGFFALDLNTRVLHEILQTGGDIIILPRWTRFFCVNYERYLPLGDGKRTVNCSFLDLWNAQLQRTRFSSSKVAQFYGGSYYQQGSDEEYAIFLPGETE